jgi:predicted RNA-binding Zn-ribbon protein involved in translation (DUF1610 family)/predicted DNA-binding protein (UPF0251 family)
MTPKIDLPINLIIKQYTIDMLSTVKIAKLYNVSNCTISAILRKNNIKIRQVNLRHNPNSSHKIILTKEQINEVIRLYSIEHLSTVIIGKQFGVSFPTILRILRENNIEVIDSHNNKYRNDLIDLSKLPPLIHNPKHINHGLTGEVTCPKCGKLRRLQLSNQRIKDIAINDGKCNICTMKDRASILDVNIIKDLYINNNLTMQQLSRKFHCTSKSIKEILLNNNITIKSKFYYHTLKINNNGTLESPILGDMCKGTDIGLNDKAFYVRIACAKCGLEQWRCKSHIVRGQILCRECAMIKFGENHRGEKAFGWKGGLSFEPYDYKFNDRLKEQIRKRDNYTCQLCGKKQNGIKLSVHHIDYNKKNSNPTNLISLCSAQRGIVTNNTSCHTKTNANRKYWTKYFNNLLIKLGVISSEP